MPGLALVGHQFRYDQKAFWRNPASVFFTVMFPVVVFLILAIVFSGHTFGGRGGQQPSVPNPASFFFTVMSPFVVFLILAIVFSGDTVDVRGGVDATTYY